MGLEYRLNRERERERSLIRNGNFHGTVVDTAAATAEAMAQQY